MMHTNSESDEVIPGKLYIYLIDDDLDHILLISRALRDVDGAVESRSFSDPQEALDALFKEERLADLILLDINMPGLSGFDVLRKLKEDERLKRIPVVMLTSSELSSDVAKAYELGASGYISKPSYMHDIRAILGNTLLYWSAMKRATGSTEV